MSEWKKTVQVPFEITEEFVSDVLTSAFEGGSNYWIQWNGFKVVKDIKGIVHLSEVVAKGGIVSILPDEDPGIEGHEEGTPFKLDRDIFVQGFQRYIEFCMKHGRAIQVDPGDIDANEADLILQLALFNDEVFC